MLHKLIFLIIQLLVNQRCRIKILKKCQQYDMMVYKIYYNIKKIKIKYNYVNV